MSVWLRWLRAFLFDDPAENVKLDPIAPTNDIERFALSLQAAGIAADHRDLADILWLARLLPEPQVQAPKPIPEPVRAPVHTADTSLAPDSEPATSTQSGGATDSVRSAVSGGVYISSQAHAGKGGIAASTLRVPAVPALPRQYDIARALRPFTRRRPSEAHVEFDPETTVERFADTGVLAPVLRSRLERWFDVAVVSDAGSSMLMWRQTNAEFARLLTRVGAFRDVRRWTLALAEDEVHLVSESGLVRDWRELIDPSSRRIILLVTDCIGPHWDRPAIWKMLAGWGASTPVVLAQVLPERLWPVTPLGGASTAVGSRFPGVPNTKLELALPWWDVEEMAGHVAVPVMTLAPESVNAWAQLVMARGNASTPSVIARTPEAAHNPPPNLSELTSEQRVQRFKRMVSPEAYQLAVYFSAVPLNLPVMRLVQFAMTPKSELSHLAEVFLGGIVERVGDPDAKLSPEEVEYDFVTAAGGGKGVREILQASLMRSQSLEVLQAVSVYLERNFGQPLDFRALITDTEGKSTLPADAAPFATIARTLLKQSERPRYASCLITWARSDETDLLASQLGRDLVQEGVPCELEGERPPISIPLQGRQVLLLIGAAKVDSADELVQRARQAVLADIPIITVSLDRQWGIQFPWTFSAAGNVDFAGALGDPGYRASFQTLLGLLRQQARQTPKPVNPWAGKKFKNDVFVSCSHSDDELHWLNRFNRDLQAVLDQVRAERTTVWSEASLSPGSELGSGGELAGVLIDNLGDSSVFVPLVTPRYLGSAWCLRELQEFLKAAQRNGGLSFQGRSRVIPVLVGDIARYKLPFPLEDVQGIDLPSFEAALSPREISRIANALTQTLDLFRATASPNPPPREKRLPLWELIFDKHGELSPGQSVEQIAAQLQQRGITDVFILIHGWNVDHAEARAILRQFGASLRSVDDQSSRRLGAIGAVWPSKLWADDPPHDSDYAHPRKQLSSAHETNLRVAADRVQRSPDDPEALENLHGLVQEIGDPGQSESMPEETPEEPSLLGGIFSNAKNLLRVTTYFQMRARAGVVGRQGLGPAIGQLSKTLPGLRIHLVAYSVGTRLAGYALTGLPATGTPASPVKSMTLVQAFMSDQVFAPSGALAEAVHRVDGPVVVTYSRNDTAATNIYPLVTRVIGRDDDAPGLSSSPVMALASNGAKGVSATELNLQPVHGPYQFGHGHIFNVDASSIVSSHGDTMDPEIAWLALSAATADRPA